MVGFLHVVFIVTCSTVRYCFLYQDWENGVTEQKGKIKNRWEQGSYVGTVSFSFNSLLSSAVQN